MLVILVALVLAHFTPPTVNERDAYFESFPSGVDIPSRLKFLPANVIKTAQYWHYSMMNDKPRTEAFRKAIFQTVAPGDVVIDIGAGTGILSMYAAQAGAKKVYAIEASTTFALIAEENVAQSKFSDRISVIFGMSTDVDICSERKDDDSELPCIPERANVLIAEILGTMLDGESAIYYMDNARRRLLTKKPKIIPVFGTQYASVISSRSIQNMTSVDDFAGLGPNHFNILRDSVGFLFSKQLGVPLNMLDDFQELTSPMQLYEVDFRSDGSWVKPEKIVMSPTVIKSGTGVAVMYFWEAFLDSGKNIRISTHPRDTVGNLMRDMSWGQGLTLLEDPKRWEDLIPAPLKLKRGRKTHILFHFEDMFVTAKSITTKERKQLESKLEL